MINPNFEKAQERLVLEASNLTAKYLLSRYGNGKVVEASKVDLAFQNNPISNATEATGSLSIKCVAETAQGYENLNVNVACNVNELEVESEVSVQYQVEKDLNSAAEYLPTDEVVKASLESFKLLDNGSKYLTVKHAALANAAIGVIGKAEYASSKDKVSLLKSVVNDAFPQTKIAFEGEWREPNIDTEVPMSGEEEMEWYCPTCKNTFESWDIGQHKGCPGELEVMTDKTVVPSMTEEEHYQEWMKEHPEKHSDDLPLARLSDHLAQSMQAEEQRISAAKIKLSDKVAQETSNHLYRLGYMSKVQEINTDEVSVTENGLHGTVSVIATVEDKGSKKIVALPITVKANQIEMPKKPLISELINKAVDLNQRLSEELAKDTLQRLAAIDEKIAYEANEVESILSSDLIKTASDSGEGTQYMPENDSITLQKHFLPAGADKLEVGECIFADGSYWKLVDKEGAQNDKNKDSSSLWKFTKCDAPKDDKEPEIRVKI